MSHIVTATFKNRQSYEDAIRRLEDIGVKHDQISMVVTDETRHNHFKIEDASKVDEGTAAGAAVGGLLGTALSLLTAAGVMVIPGVNLVVAGSLVAALAGLGAGAVTGGLVGGLIGAGIPEHEAKLYEEEIKSGGVLLAVRSRDDEEKRRIKRALEISEAYNIAA